jgi:Nuclease-related domain
MRVVRNIGHVKRKRKIAQWASILGFIGLSSLFFFFFFPVVPIVVSYSVLLSAFVAFNFGMQQLGKWSNTPRHLRNDLAIDEPLNSLSDKYVLLHYMRFGKKVVEHLLIYPGGLLVLTARDVPGVIVANGSRWRRKNTGLLRMFGMSGPQLGNPSYENEESIALVREKLAAAQLEYDVSGAIVFTAQSLELDVEESDRDAIAANELLEYIKEIEVDPSFKTTERDALVELLTNGEEIERTERASTRRPVRVKRRAASKT